MITRNTQQTIKTATLPRPRNCGVRELWLDRVGDEYRVYMTTNGQVLDARQVQRFSDLAKAEHAFTESQKQ